MKKILGIGNALVDIMTKIRDDNFLQEFGLAKGSMTLVSEILVNDLEEATANFEKHKSSGGSAANAIHGLARMGVPAGFIGKVGNDEPGNFFFDDMVKSHIDPILFRSSTETGRAVALISPDSERTFATFLGAAVELSPDELTESQFRNYDHIHIEGYLVQNHDLLEKTYSLAKNRGMRVSLDLASYNIVEDNLGYLKSFVEDCVDILFANEEEAKSFTGKNPREALDGLAEMCEIAVVKVGKEGSLIKKGNDRIKIEPIKAKAIDTTGAGDAYAAGFLYGLANNRTLEECGHCGSVIAGKVIEVIGAKMDNNKWNEIGRIINQLL